MAFPFLSLPLELRQPIYRYVLPYSVDESWSDLRERRYLERLNLAPVRRVRWYNGICTSIVFANRQIHEEACEILYHENKFSIYVKHPRQPRLPINESRADEDSFVHIAWHHRTWSHPRNPKIPFAVLRNHRHLSQICRLQINLPEMRDLIAADMYMRTTSYASHHGLNAWMEKLRATGGELSDGESERMNYINQIKGPTDEVAALLRSLPRIDWLVIIFMSEPAEVAFIEYVASGLLHLRGIKRVECIYQLADSGKFGASVLPGLRNEMMEPRMRTLERELESSSMPKLYQHVTGLSPEAIEMLEMLEAMRKRMLLIRELRSDYVHNHGQSCLPVITNIIGE